MSDDDYDYEYDYGFSDEDIPDDLADHVDSLAEHTLHSPVLVNAHPDFEVDYDELAYMTDEYYDGDKDTTSPNGAEEKDVKLGKRKRGDTEEGRMDQQKRRKKEDVPLVVWRKKSHDEKKDIPTIKPKEGHPIALLPNWRELFDENREENSTGKPVLESKQPAGQEKASVPRLKISEKASSPRRGKRPREVSTSPIAKEGVKLGSRTRKVQKV